MGWFTRDWTLYRFTEPVVVAVIAYCVDWFDPASAFWLYAAAMALFVKNNLVYQAYRNKILDIIDARIEVQNLSGALQGKPKQKTAGFTVVPVLGTGTLSDFTIEDTVNAVMNRIPQTMDTGTSNGAAKPDDFSKTIINVMEDQ